MTPQEMIDVIQAYRDGKSVEYNNGDDIWIPIDMPTWNFNKFTYRVKPPELRPHYPALVKSPIMTHSVTGVLFGSEDEARGVIGFVRLATEYPPVMLP